MRTSATSTSPISVAISVISAREITISVRTLAKDRQGRRNPHSLHTPTKITRSTDPNYYLRSLTPKYL